MWSIMLMLVLLPGPAPEADQLKAPWLQLAEGDEAGTVVLTFTNRGDSAIVVDRECVIGFTIEWLDDEKTIIEHILVEGTEVVPADLPECFIRLDPGEELSRTLRWNDEIREFRYYEMSFVYNGQMVHRPVGFERMSVPPDESQPANVVVRFGVDPMLERAVMSLRPEVREELRRGRLQLYVGKHEATLVRGERRNDR